MKKYSFAILLFFIFTLTQAQKGHTFSVAFYNVENLYDTKDDKDVDDQEFTPDSKKQWNKEKYEKKLNNIGYVISQLDKPHTPAIIGLAEVENKGVLEDLIKTKHLKNKDFRIVHQDSPDLRGIDVALLYDPKQFEMKSHKTYKYNSPDNPSLKTRDQLLVSGKMAGEWVHIIVNHWPSRRGNSSGELREFAASITKHIADSIYKSNPKAKIIIMGDLNDNPNDNSCRLILNAKKDGKEVKAGGLFNPMWQVYESGIGSLRYKDEWHLFDQIIVSQSLLDSKSALRFMQAEVFNPDFLIQQEGRYKGYPLRTFSGDIFLNGYADHFPTLIYLSYDKK